MKHIAGILIMCVCLQIVSIGFSLDINAAPAEETVIYSNDAGEILNPGKKWEFSFESVEEEPRFMEIEYITELESTVTPQLGISLNGGERTVVDVPRRWTNELTGKRFDRDGMGNEQSPSQKEEHSWQRLRLMLPNSKGRTDLGIIYGVGKHKVTFEMVNQIIKLRKVILVKAEKAPEYKEYKKEFSKTKTPKFSRTYEAELSSAKSHPEITVSFDRTSPDITPNHPVRIYYNIIGGSGYSKPGQWVEWKINVPRDGWYNIDFKYRQNINAGQTVKRELAIDGEVKFDECAVMEFPSCGGFEIKTVCDKKGKDAPVFLEKGSHTLRLTAVIGSTVEPVQNLRKAVSMLNRLYTKIITIVGEAPDPYRDYDLDTNIPELVSTFKNVNKVLAEVEKSVKAEVGGKNTDNSAMIEQAEDLFEEFIKEPRNVATKLDGMRSQINTLASIMSKLGQQPLELDSLTVRADTPKNEGKAGFFELLSFRFKSFISSFAADYNSVSDKSGRKNMNVWVTTNDMATVGFSTGREQAQIVTQLVREDFAVKNNISANVSLMDSGVILQALVSGRGPDVALFVPDRVLSNLYFRHALIDLRRMDNYDEIIKRFLPSSTISLSYDGALFAVPEVQSYDMMFYRTDIFEEKGLKVPETWDELYDVLVTLQKDGMQVGLPESQATYEAFVFQRGGKFYKDDLSKTLLTSDSCVSSFADWTDLYVKRGVPVSYDVLNRFRTGEGPITITSSSFYNNLMVGAIEISGNWAMAPIPGTPDENGNINRSETCRVSGAAILKSVKNLDNAFKFIDWWSSDEVQKRFAFECEIRFGVTARYFPANINTLESMPWNTQEYSVLNTQRQALTNIPQSPATYYLSRNLSNAFRRVVYEFENPRDVIYRYGRDTDNELKRKFNELGLKESDKNE